MVCYSVRACVRVRQGWMDVMHTCGVQVLCMVCESYSHLPPRGVCSWQAEEASLQQQRQQQQPFHLCLLPMSRCTLGCAAQMCGSARATRSIPFLYTNRHNSTTTTASRIPSHGHGSVWWWWWWWWSLLGAAGSLPEPSSPAPAVALCVASPSDGCMLLLLVSCWEGHAGPAGNGVRVLFMAISDSRAGRMANLGSCAELFGPSSEMMCGVAGRNTRVSTAAVAWQCS